VYGWIDKWMDEWMDEWMNEWMNGVTDPPTTKAATDLRFAFLGEIFDGLAAIFHCRSDEHKWRRIKVLTDDRLRNAATVE
jgi:hypothetical protein